MDKEKFPQRILEIKGSPVTLREGEPGDASALIDFLARIAEETHYTFNHPGQRLNAEILASRLSGEKLSRDQLRLLAIEDGNVIGQIVCRRSHPDHPWLDHKAEFAMMVRRDWWGSGLAKELLREMETFARSLEIRRLEATVSCLNERGVALYTKAGFSLEGTARAFKIVDGKEMDSFYIAKIL